MSRAEASYYDGKAMQQAYSNKVKIRVQNSSLMVAPYVNITQGIGGQVDVVLALKNIYRGNLDVRSFEINIPEGLGIISGSSDLEKKGQRLLWKGVIERDESKNVTFSLNAKKAGNFTIEIKEKYVDESDRNVMEQITFQIACDCPLIQHKLLRKDEDTAHLRAYLSNPSYNNMFNNVNVHVSTDIPNAEVEKEYPTLSKRDTILLFNDDIEIPAEGYFYTVEIEYESEHGQKFKDSKNIVVERARSAENESDTAHEISVNESEQPETESETVEVPDEKQSNVLLVVLILAVVMLLIWAAYNRMSKRK